MVIGLLHVYHCVYARPMTCVRNIIVYSELETNKLAYNAYIVRTVSVQFLYACNVNKIC